MKIENFAKAFNISVRSMQKLLKELEAENVISRELVYIAVKSPNRKVETVKNIIIETLSKFPKSAVKTTTTDNGNEFAAWEFAR